MQDDKPIEDECETYNYTAPKLKFHDENSRDIKESDYDLISPSIRDNETGHISFTCPKNLGNVHKLERLKRFLNC